MDTKEEGSQYQMMECTCGFSYLLGWHGYVVWLWLRVSIRMVVLAGWLGCSVVEDC